MEQRDINLGVVGGRLKRGMTEDRPDGREGGPLAHHLGRGGVAEHVRAIAGARHVRTAERSGGNVGDGFGAERTDWRRAGQKDVRARNVGPCAFPIDEERVAHLLRQRESRGALRLACQAECAIVPVNIAPL